MASERKARTYDFTWYFLLTKAWQSFLNLWNSYSGKSYQYFSNNIVKTYPAIIFGNYSLVMPWAGGSPVETTAEYGPRRRVLGLGWTHTILPRRYRNLKEYTLTMAPEIMWLGWLIDARWSTCEEGMMRIRLSSVKLILKGYPHIVWGKLNEKIVQCFFNV